MDPTVGHVPVLLAETLEQLAPRPGKTILDGTAGGGGHAMALLDRLRPGGRLILLDRDQEALERLMARVGRSDDVRYFHANFCDFDEALTQAGEERVDGILLDLGISSLQLADPERGFSFDHPGPLDMRLDRTDPFTADEIVNQWPAERLVDIFSRYGDQPFARRIAAAIVRARENGPLGRTDELAEIVRSALPPAARHGRIHPATRVFQAIRIAVNQELQSLERFFDKVFDHLKPGGRVAVIAFHSGEDRIVKTRLREAVRAGRARLSVAKPITPTPAEVNANPRSRSARMRVAEAVAPTG
ncbi:MAG: 16S rRNA (cytosine(1402)-N(4))-methyltransferase RsmH [Planctomycetota bacterium]|nr:16S rRNA (cytosine(1402)-N(4))-methyltransferase RsmH [Planctomycetota bacterium]